MKKIVQNYPLEKASCAIFLNGEKSQIKQSQLTEYDDIVVTDGAWNVFSQQCNTEQYTDRMIVLGDGDSIHDRPENFVETPNQAYTDFEKALRYLLEKKISCVDVFWAEGRNVDHFLGNLSVGAVYANQITVRFFNAQQSYFLLSDINCFEIDLVGMNDETISLYPFPKAVITSKGLQYPLKKLALSLGRQQSLRNRACSDTIQITLHKGRVWVIITNA